MWDRLRKPSLVVFSAKVAKLVQKGWGSLQLCQPEDIILLATSTEQPEIWQEIPEMRKPMKGW
jgi:hypothetical protein